MIKTDKGHPSYNLLSKALIALPVIFLCGDVKAYLPVFPLDPNNPSAVHQGAGRFGEGRESKNKNPQGFGTYGHQGIDISAPMKTKLYAVADSIVVGSVDTGKGGGVGTALKPINGPDIVVVYWHQQGITDKVSRIGNKVKAGDHIGMVGNTSSPKLPPVSANMAPHLHLGIGVRNPAEAVNLWLNNTPRTGGKFYKTGLGGEGGVNSHTRRFNGKSYLWTNPAPYLPRDVLIWTSLKAQDPLIKYLGTSIRSQYNALTGAKLPLGRGARAGVYADKIPKLNIQNNGVPSDFSTEMKQAAVVGVLEGGNADELLGQDSITPEVLAYYAKPRTIFVGNESEVNIDIGDGDITQSELINKIGTSRFGNIEWQKELVGTSMRGMLTDYLNGINAKNFIKKETIKQKERIESLYAAWTASVTKMNHSASLQETFDKVPESTIIPEVSTLAVEELYEMIDEGMDVASYDLGNALSLTDGQYKSCDPAYISNFKAMPMAKRKELLALALRLGFHPNDFATAVAVETSFVRDQNLLYPPSKMVKKKNGKMGVSNPAGGYIQLTPGGAGDMPYNRYVSLYPATKSILNKHLGSNLVAGASSRAHGPYLRELGNLNPRYEFAMYDAYFYSKNKGFNSVPPSKKTLGLLYRMIFGKGYARDAARGTMSAAGYEKNRQYDINNDGFITPEEAVKNSRFRVRNCPYWTDAEILSNAYGLTDADLKYIPWSAHINRMKSPTVDNLGGNFSVVQSMKARMNNSVGE